MRRGQEPGAVTAEAAVVMPLLAAFTIVLVWLVWLGTAHIRAVDAARETARAAARGESDARAVALGLRVAVDGSRVSVRHSGQLVKVSVVSPVAGPGGLLRRVGSATLRAQAVAVREPATGSMQ